MRCRLVYVVQVPLLVTHGLQNAPLPGQPTAPSRSFDPSNCAFATKHSPRALVLAGSQDLPIWIQICGAIIPRTNDRRYRTLPFSSKTYRGEHFEWRSPSRGKNLPHLSRAFHPFFCLVNKKTHCLKGGCGGHPWKGIVGTFSFVCFKETAVWCVFVMTKQKKRWYGGVVCVLSCHPCYLVLDYTTWNSSITSRLLPTCPHIIIHSF